MRGLAEVTRALKRGGQDAAFAVDGPRGPYGVAKGGAWLAARASGGVVVPMGSAFERGMVLEKAWDRFGIAWPFSRVAVALGAPIDASRDDASASRAIEERIAFGQCMGSRGPHDTHEVPTVSRSLGPRPTDLLA